MNKKLSLILLLLLFISLISVLLTFMAFSKTGNNEDVNELKTGYEQLSKQVNELKVTTDDLDSKVNSPATTSTATPQTTQTPQATTPPTPTVQTKTVSASKVNMRSGANTNAQLIRQLSSGEKVTPTGATASAGGYQWVQIKDSKGATGWIVGSYIK